MMNWGHHQSFDEHRINLMREIERENRVRRLLADTPGRLPARRRALAWLGERLEAWGARLTEGYADAANAVQVKATGGDQGNGDSRVIVRLIAYRDEVYRLPANSLSLRVLSGSAWVTASGRDIVVKRGERICLSAGGDFALASALGGSPLVLELCNACERPMAGRLATSQALTAG